MTAAGFPPPAVVPLERIREALERVDVLPLIEDGFEQYSRGRVVVPPVGELLFDDPPGDVHIKYGRILGDGYFLIKIASGFYDNPRLGLPSSNGLMLLFDAATGRTVCLLLDEGHLTNVRTAAAGAVVARHMAPEGVERAGILGAGLQGRLQAEWLRKVRPVKELVAWGVDDVELAAYRRDMEALGFSVRITRDAAEVARTCDLIVTCTPSTAPLLRAEWIRPGTHVTAMGSDTAGKQELDPEILARADLVVSDSLPQSESRGEVFRAVAAGALRRDRVVELGTLIERGGFRRTTGREITVADLTGVAVQDIQIGKAVWKAVQEDAP